MSRSKREIPHYYLTTTIDMGAAAAWLRAENERRSVTDRVLMIALLVKSVARALEQTPDFRPGSGIHIGCAISLRGGGLIAPAVHDANRLDVGSLMKTLADLVARARAGSLKSSELSDATITLTNLGEQGVEATLGIINPPQVALVGFGRIVDRPWVVDGAVQVRPIVTASLAADHRASDGHRGGTFLMAVERALQHPEEL
jgi:pyruvate dehydrogenase E2 component (dihydrolipoamide acetyltransferase)